jgi:predicted lactoylglutathione lyase
MTLPQRISYITLGARDMAALRAFYAAMGWSERPGSDDNFATYEVGSALLALYPMERLGQEAASGEQAPGASHWNGITLGVNVGSSQDVDQIFEASVAAGARAVANPVDREWGGYSGYISDPEGNRWEITWAPEG